MPGDPDPVDPNPMDDLIRAIQGGAFTPPVPQMPEPAPAESISVPSHYAFSSDPADTSSDGVLAFKPGTLNDLDCILLHYKTITSLITGQSYATQYQLSHMKFKLVESAGVSDTLGGLPQKDRENRVIKIAEALSDVGRYPNVLFAFEWRDAATGKRLKHMLPKEGHVRG